MSREIARAPRAVNNRCPRQLPSEWLCPYAASQPHSYGVRMAVNWVIRGTCIRTRLPHAAGHEVTLIAIFGDQFGLARPGGPDGGSVRLKLDRAACRS